MGADSALVAWGVVVMTAVGFAVGFRLGGSVGDALAAFGLTILYGFAFVWMFIAMGLAAGQPAGGAEPVVPGLPAQLRLVGLRAGVDDAGLDAGLRQPTSP